MPAEYTSQPLGPRSLPHTPYSPNSLEIYSSEQLDNIPVVHGEAQLGEISLPYTAAVGGRRLAVVVPGLFGCHNPGATFGHELAAHDYTVVTYGQARKGSSRREDYFHPQLLHTEALQTIIDTVVSHPDITNEVDADTVRLDPHSMGMHAAIGYALKHPDEVASSVALAPNGLIRNFYLRIAEHPVGLAKESLTELHSALQQADLRRSLGKHIIHNPIRTASEVISCTTQTVTAQIKYLGNLGIPMEIIGFKGDDIINPRHLQKAAKKLGVPYTEYPDTQAGHNAYTHPAYVKQIAAFVAATHERLEHDNPLSAA